MPNMLTRTVLTGLIRQIARTGAFVFLTAACLLAGFGSATVRAQGMTLDICPTDYGSFPENAPQLTCGCDAESVKKGNVRGANPYYYQSSLCRAALHAGAVGPEGGQIVVRPEKATIFPAVPRHGVTADSWSEGMGFRVVVSQQPTAPTAAGTAAPTQTTGMTLDVCPTDYGSFPENAPPLTCGCDAASVKKGNVRGANPYYYQSSVCRAALHAGAIGPDGGQILVQPEKATIFPAVPRNGVAADSWSEGMGFRVVIAGQPAATKPPAAGAAGAPAQAVGITLDICPTNYGSFREDAPALTCSCDAVAAKTGNVRGANPYYYQSSLCRAALHAGAIGPEGGQVVVQPRKSPLFPAVTRNGVAAGSWSQGMGFSVSAAAGGRASASPIFDAANSAGMTLDICPTDYGSFPEDAPALTCGCDAASAKRGNVRGANPYYYQSSVCRAALHAGAIGADGGKIVVKPEKAAVFPAVTRNGVKAGSWSQGMGFHVSAVPGSAPVAAAPPPAVAAARPAVDASGKPIQAPIASTLRETGRVQLYINFATDQDKPLPSSEPVLRELLATLQGEGGLRVMLIGHTDSQGSAPHNLDLSQRRAAAVYLWLIQRGVDSGRLRSDGRGLMEPIADNGTESGRALNRRVEVRTAN